MHRLWAINRFFKRILMKKKINIIRGKILFNKMLNEFEMVEMKPKRNFILNVNGLSDHLNIKTLY